MYLLGYDIGSSSIKASLVDANTGKGIATTQQPKKEMNMIAHQNGWAEQNPEDWWKYICLATKELIDEHNINPSDIKSIGIAYQMHGLVVVDEDQNVLRPSIIWCDSRAVSIGELAIEEIGKKKCLSAMLNSPGNFTASKLKWVKENEPDIYSQIDKIMLPGDYIAMMLTGEISTTTSGLSEGILWDFESNTINQTLLDYYDIDHTLIPSVLDTFSIQGKVSEAAADACGLVSGIPVTYRAGDQPNNALSLGVMEANEVAATGGTSGVIYAVVDNPQYDEKSRVNGFAHVNHKADAPRIGILLCINGTGIQYSWVRENIALDGMHYGQLEKEAQKISIGSDGLIMLPFGNGAERMLENLNVGAHIQNLEFNIHTRSHLYRAALEGIAFSFYYGFKILSDMGLKVGSMRVGNDNLFQSVIFSETVSTLLQTEIEVIETTGAIGAAQASGIAVGIFSDIKEATANRTTVKRYVPNNHLDDYHKAYENWEHSLLLQLQNHKN